MDNLRIASAQFENKSGDKNYNLSIIRQLTELAASEGAEVIAFHECSITGYTFARNLSRDQMFALAEPIPDGGSVRVLTQIAGETKVAILAGLFEKEGEDRLYKAYICVDGTGVVAKYRKLHPFINPHLLPGDQYVVFDLRGWKCGILICYDNTLLSKIAGSSSRPSDAQSG
jgi:5-aminopentanamidase